jgi:hypothetical protein
MIAFFVGEVNGEISCHTYRRVAGGVLVEKEAA